MANRMAEPQPTALTEKIIGTRYRARNEAGCDAERKARALSCRTREAAAVRCRAVWSGPRYALSRGVGL